VATGVALALKHSEPGRLACAYIGDGTWGEGAVYEALNMASLWRVPLLVVVEHNGVAQSTPTSVQMAGTVRGRAHAFGLGHHRTASVDVVRIRAEIAPLVDRVRAGTPLVLEFATHRIGPHSKGDDTRSPAELDRVRSFDWYRRYGDAFPELFRRCDAESRERIDRVVRAVSAAPPARWDAR
jgi:TPP-dependent pyruvate/acetoin dehydrogenase alpha subunit